MISRIFLGVEEPFLHSAVERLTALNVARQSVELDRFIVVTPGARAGRRLLELLLQRAERLARPLFPPRCLTVGEVPELFVPLSLQILTPLQRKSYWYQALRAEPFQALVPLVGTRFGTGDSLAWWKLAAQCDRLREEVSGGAHSFASVLKVTEQRAGFSDSLRWEVLAKVEESYERLLTNSGVFDTTSARRRALDEGATFLPQELILIGVVDISVITRKFLERISSPLHIWCAAQESQGSGLDHLGTLIQGERTPQCRQERNDGGIFRDETRVLQVDGLDEQLGAVAAFIAQEAPHCAPSEITVGVPKESTIPALAEFLQGSAVPVHLAGGRPLASRPLFSFLRLVARCVESHPAIGIEYRAVAECVRHPLFAALLRRQGLSALSHEEQITALDRYYLKHLPYRISDRSCVNDESRVRLHAILAALDPLTTPLKGDARPLPDWCDSVRAVLVELLPLIEDSDDDTFAFLAHLRDLLEAVKGLRLEFAPLLRGPQALLLLLEETATTTLPHLGDTQAVDLVGWLELPLDDASFVAVLDMNEGVAPAAVTGDLFLPNSLRTALGLVDNERRFARDQYVLNALQVGRKKTVLITPRRNGEGNPVLPSRLLLQGTGVGLAKRVLHLFGRSGADEELSMANEREEDGAEDTRVSRSSAPAPAVGDSNAPKREQAVRAPCLPLPPFPPPPVSLAEPPRTLRVTAIKDYLFCPYRYYLRHILNVNPIQDAVQELDAAAFGSLIHEVLSDFGRSALARSAEPAPIEGYLLESLERLVAARYGRDVLPAVRVQVELLKSRFTPFSEWQAEHTAQGWEIRHVEYEPGKEARNLALAGREEIALVGRIDRIDYHPRERRWAIFDYKSGEEAVSPEAAHLEKRRGQPDMWKDLQLPAYHYLISREKGVDELQLGYLRLSAKAAKIEANVSWDSELLRQSVQKLKEVGAAVYQQKFWPPKEVAQSRDPFRNLFEARWVKEQAA